MLRRKKALLLIISFIFVLLSGCWSRKEIETLAFVTMLGLDKEGLDMVVTAQIALPQSGQEGGGSSSESPVWTVAGRGRTLGEATREMTKFIGKKIFMPHVRAIIIGEELAKFGIEETLDYLVRDVQLRGTPWIAVSKGKAAEIMAIEPKLSTMPAFYLDEMFTNVVETSLAPKVTWLDFLRNYVSTSGGSPYAPVLHKFDAGSGRKSEFTAQGENANQEESGGQQAQGGGDVQPPGEALSLEQVAVFKDDKLVGWLTNAETRGLLYIRGEVERGVEVLTNTSLGEGTVTKRVTFAKSNIKVKAKGEDLIIDIFISQEGNLLEQTVSAKLNEPKNIEILNRDMEAKIKNVVNQALFKLQKQLQTDITGIALEVREQQPEWWINNNWEEVFPVATINVHVDANLRRTGATNWPAFIKKPWE